MSRGSSESNRHGLGKRDNKVLTSNTTLSNSLRESLSLYLTAASSCTSSSELIEVPANEWRDPLAGNFVNYLPQDEAVAAGVGVEEGGLDPVQSQKVVDLLNIELSRLLKLSPRDFWREVAIDTSLLDFLDSFLKYRNRWYDFSRHQSKGVLAGAIIGDIDLSRRVFMVLYRMSSSRDPSFPAADSLNSKEHAIILQDKKLLDLPKLFDICAIYGHENEELTRLLVMNAIKAQPNIHENLTAVLTHFLCILNTMRQHCFSSLEDQSRHEDRLSGPLFADFLEVMDFINDAVASMDAFITFYKPAAFYFSCRVETSYGNEELVMTIARLHDALFPSLEHWFRMKLSLDEERMLNIKNNLKMLSSRMVNFGWKLLDLCYLRDEAPAPEDHLGIPMGTKTFLSHVEDPLARSDILIQIFKDIRGASFLRCIDKNHHLMNRLENLQMAGWIVMDDEHIRCLSGMLHLSQEKESPVFRIVVDEEEAAIKESKVTEIKDLFPDYRQGFLSACLEVYNQNAEEVIQHILDGTLHEDLQQLDSSLETLPHHISVSAVTQTKNKGKAVVESTILHVSQKTNLPSASSSSVAIDGRCFRKSNQLWPCASSILNARNNGGVESTATRFVMQYEYEDEYDDSFDDLGFSMPGSGLEERDEASADDVRDGKNFNTDTEACLGSNPVRSRFYVKDGKNYSYKVKGSSVGVADAREVALVKQEQEELVYGIGRGGNIRAGSMYMMWEFFGKDEVQDTENQRGGRRRGGGKGRGRGSSHNRKTKASNKHSSGLSGY